MKIKNLFELKELERELLKVVRNGRFEWKFGNSYRFEYEIVEDDEIECRISFEIVYSSRFLPKTTLNLVFQQYEVGDFYFYCQNLGNNKEKNLKSVEDWRNLLANVEAMLIDDELDNKVSYYDRLESGFEL